MRKRVFGRKLGRNRGARRALFRSLIRELVRYGRIKTTKAKAKAVQPDIDKIMGKVRDGGLSARRAVLAKLGNDKETTKKLFGELSVLTKTRKSGFTRVIVLPKRKGDNAEVVILELVGLSESQKAKKGKTK